MISLKQGDDYNDCMVCSNEYGYGTSISLNGEQCEALGITKMSAGQSVSIKANGIVTRASEELERATDSGGKDISISIQLTEMTISNTGAANPKKAAAILYGEDD